jgi:hypothetical protein
MIFWESHISFLKSKESYSLLDQIYGKVLALFPKKPEFWISAAMFELENKQNFHASRIFLQRAIRVNNKNKELWYKYYELEVWNVLRIVEQYRILHSSSSSASSSDSSSSSSTSSTSSIENKVMMIDEETRNKLENTLLIVFKHACSSLYPSSSSSSSSSGRSAINEKIVFPEVEGDDEKRQGNVKKKKVNDSADEDDEDEDEEMDTDDVEDEVDDQQLIKQPEEEEEVEGGRSLTVEEKKENLLILFQMFSLSYDLFSFFPNFLKKMKNQLISIDSLNQTIWRFLFQCYLQQSIKNKILPLLQMEPAKMEAEEAVNEEKKTKSKSKKSSSHNSNDDLNEEILSLVKAGEDFIKEHCQQEQKNFRSLIYERNASFETQLLNILLSVLFVLLSIMNRSNDNKQVNEEEGHDNNQTSTGDDRIAAVGLLLSRLCIVEEDFNDFSFFEEFSVKEFHFRSSLLSKKFLSSYETILNNVYSFFQSSLSSTSSYSLVASSNIDIASVSQNLPILTSFLHQHRALIKLEFLYHILSLNMGSSEGDSKKKETKNDKKNKSTSSSFNPFQASLSFVNSVIMKDCLLKIVNAIEKNGNIEFQSLLSKTSFHDLLNAFSHFCLFLLTVCSSLSAKQGKDLNSGISSFFIDRKKEFQSLSLLLTLTSSSKQLLLSLFSFHEDHTSSSSVVADKEKMMVEDSDSDSKDNGKAKGTSHMSWNDETCRLIITNVHIVSTEARREFLFFYMNSFFGYCLQLIHNSSNNSVSVVKKMEEFFDWIFSQFRSFPQFFSFSLIQEFFFTFLEKFGAFQQLLDKESSQSNGKRKLTLHPKKAAAMSKSDELHFTLLKKGNELNLLVGGNDEGYEETVSKCLNQLIEFYRLEGNSTIVNHLQNKRRKLH